MTLNELISAYTRQLKQGELQTAYKAILDYIGRLRAHFTKKYPFYDMSAIYQGYMDMSYFSLSPKPLKEKGLKIAVVYLHEKGAFEVWLSARNRELSKKYASFLSGIPDMAVFHDNANQDAIIEYTLTTAPDFENESSLTDTLEHGVEKFMAAVINRV
jgi:hypothetical protein